MRLTASTWDGEGSWARAGGVESAPTTMARARRRDSRRMMLSMSFLTPIVERQWPKSLVGQGLGERAALHQPSGKGRESEADREDTRRDGGFRRTRRGGECDARLAR